MLSRIHRHCTAFEVLEARALLGAHLVAALSPVTEGRDGRLTVVATIANTGDRFYKGGDKLDFLLSPETNSSYAAYGTALGIRTLPAIAARGKARLTLTFDRPAVHMAGPGVSAGYGANLPIAAGNYAVSTDPEFSRNQTTAITSDLRATSPTDVVIDGRFGRLRSGSRTLTVGIGLTSLPNYTSELLYYYLLSVHDIIGTLRIDGPGWGEIAFDEPSAHFVINLHGTTADSTLTFGAPKSSQSSFGHLIINGSLGTLRVDHSQLSGDVQINGRVRTIDLTGTPSSWALTLSANGPVSELKLASLSRSAIHLNSAATTRITARDLNGVSIDSQGGISSLEVRSWTNGMDLAAPWIGTLSSAGDLVTPLELSGEHAPGGTALSHANIKGSTAGVTWNITGNVGDVSVGRYSNINIVGNLGSMLVQNDMHSGALAATNIGRLVFNGDVGGIMGGMFVMAGANLGLNANLGTNGAGSEDSFGGGTIGSIEAAKSFGGDVLAGVDPHASLLYDGADRFLPQAGFVPGGPSRIGRVSVRGRADGARFVAATLPATATLGGTSVSTATDPHFVRSLPA